MSTVSLPIVLLLAGCALAPQSRALDAQLTAYDRSRPPAVPDEPLFAGDAHLDRAALIRAVLDRNPDVAAARAGWRAALARVPQATALDDPMLTYEVAPLSVVGDARFGQSIQLEEKLPTPGRRGLAAEVALAEAEAARGDVEVARLELAAMASIAFDDLYVATRAIAIDAQHRALVTEMQQSAAIEIASGKGAPQDAIQAQVELARIEHDRVMQEAARTRAIATINALLHRRPELPLPPPPDTLALPPAAADDVAALEDAAAQGRPELDADRARLRGGDAATALARTEARPALSLMTRYDSMWDMPEHRWMIGISVELPVARERRRAAVDEAAANQARVSAEYDRALDRIRSEVAQAAAEADEARHLLRVYDEQLLPAARARVEAARAGFVGDRNRFSDVIDAERGLRAAELEREQTLADVSRRQAELDRAVGRVPGGAP